MTVVEAVRNGAHNTSDIARATGLPWRDVINRLIVLDDEGIVTLGDEGIVISRPSS